MKIYEEKAINFSQGHVNIGRNYFALAVWHGLDWLE